MLAGDERPHREQKGVVLGIVQEPARGRRRQHRGGAGKPDDEQDRLRASRDVIRIVLAKSEEHGTRVDEDSRHPQPPGAVRRELLPPPGGVQERHAESVDA